MSFRFSWTVALGVVVEVCLLGCSATSTSSDVVPSVPSVDAGTGTETGTTPPVEEELERLLTGRFDSVDQSKSDSAYFAISLRICKVSSDELGPRVLYVEQARMESLMKPYRQRLYVLGRVDPETARSRVLELVSPGEWVGACEETSLRAVTKDETIDRPGCEVVLHRVGVGSFAGSTGDLIWNGSGFDPSPVGERCASSLNGASYASSEVTLDEQQLLSWDRGFDKNGKQVWGATGGAYRFLRRP